MSRRALLVIIWLTVAVAFNNLFTVFAPQIDLTLTMQHAIVAREAPSPYAYRVLVPAVVRGTAKVINVARHDFHKSEILAYGVYTIAALFLSLTALYFVYRLEFSEAYALFGLILTAFSMVLVFAENQPWSLLDPCLFATGLLLLRRGHRWWILPLIAVATLNRETAVFLVLLLGLAAFNKANKPSYYGWLAACFITWALVYGGVRHTVGARVHEGTISGYLRTNLSHNLLMLAIVKAFVFLGPFWLLAVSGWRSAPSYIRQALLAFPVFLAAAAPWAMWNEIRLWTPFYCLLIPLSLFGLRDWLATQNVLGTNSHSA